MDFAEPLVAKCRHGVAGSGGAGKLRWPKDFPRNLLPGGIAILGPFSVFQVGPTLNETLNLKDFNTWKASRENIKAAGLSYRSTRDLVVLAVGASYLQAQTNAARVESVQAQVQTAQALYDQAQDLRRVGMAPGIDVLRAQVELEAEQQRLVVAQNDYEKQLLTLARVIGLPPGQKFVLADKMPRSRAGGAQPGAGDCRGLIDNRPDYKRAESQVRSGGAAEAGFARARECLRSASVEITR